MLLKVVVALTITFVGMGLIVKGVHAHVGALLHSGIDLSLSQDVGRHPWTPVLDGRAVTSQRLRFGAGSVRSAACRADLGIYSLHIDHRFGFQTSPGGCRAASRVEHALTHATKASLATVGGHQVLTLSSDRRTVLVLRGRG